MGSYWWFSINSTTIQQFAMKNVTPAIHSCRKVFWPRNSNWYAKFNQRPYVFPRVKWCLTSRLTLRHTCPATQASSNSRPFHLNLILEEGKIKGNKQMYHMKYYQPTCQPSAVKHTVETNLRCDHLVECDKDECLHKSRKEQILSKCDANERYQR